MLIVRCDCILIMLEYNIEVGSADPSKYILLHYLVVSTCAESDALKNLYEFILKLNFLSAGF